MTQTTSTTWEPCSECGAITRHDDGLCYRDERHPRFHPSQTHDNAPLRKAVLARRAREEVAVWGSPTFGQESDGSR